MEKQTMDHIWSQYRCALKRFLHSKVACEADVEDLLQDIFLKSYLNLSSLKDSKSIKPWLYQIAQNSVIDFYRRRAKEHSHLTQALTLPLDDKRSVKDTLLHCLTPFIDALPESDAQLLKAIDLERQSQKEYAKTHGIHYSTLKSRVQKSRTQLKAVFDQCCHFEMDSQGTVIDYIRKSKHDNKPE